MITIEDYLVKVGFKMNMTELNQMLELISKAKNSLSSLLPSATKGIVGSTVAVVSAIAASAVGVAKLVEAVADADIETEKLARRMWMSEEAVRGMSVASNALGYDLNNLSDIAMNRELTSQFVELYNLTKELSAPSELQEQLKLVRAITFEFKRFNIIAGYSIQNVVYYLNKFLGGRLSSIQETLSDINNNIIKNMPIIAEKIAKALYIPLRVGEAFFKLIIAIKNAFLNLPTEIKTASILIGSYLLLATMPINLIILGVLALILLWEDYLTYVEGGTSALEDMWKSFEDGYGRVEPVLTFVWNTLKSIYGILSLVAGIVPDVFDMFTGDFGFDTTKFNLKNIKDIWSKNNNLTGSAEGSAGSAGAGGKNVTLNFTQDNKVYSSNPQSAGKQVSQQSEVAVNRVLSIMTL